MVSIFFYEISATRISYSEECMYNVDFALPFIEINFDDLLRYRLTKNMHL